MQQASALIVDDSKTAQLRLRRMLEPYDLEIDVVSSAEEALSFLTYRAPTVIFLDQSMKGMDGIAMLKTIKANPATATIPVIMYTSEKGEVFTGQARALGALDILYKSTLQPANLEKVMSTLRLKPVRPVKEVSELDIAREQQKAQKQAKRKEAAPAPAAAVTKKSATPKMRRSGNEQLDEVQTQVARLFEIHIADVARRITESTLLLSKRVAVLHNKINNTKPEVFINDIPLSVIQDEVEAERKRIKFVTTGLLASVLVGMLVMSGILIVLLNNLNNTNKSLDNMTASAMQNEQKIAQLSQLIGQPSSSPMVITPAPAQAANGKMLSVMSWISATDFSFDYSQNPLHDDQLFKLQQMVYMLDDAGYEGVVEVIINFGDACLTRSDSGVMTLAANNLPLDQCVFRRTLEETFDAESFRTLAFSNFEQTTDALRNGQIELLITSNGLTSPRVALPTPLADMNAKTWNDTALKNNYLSFYFHSSEKSLGRR